MARSHVSGTFRFTYSELATSASIIDITACTVGSSLRPRVLSTGKK